MGLRVANGAPAPVGAMEMLAGNGAMFCEAALVYIVPPPDSGAKMFPPGAVWLAVLPL